MLGPNNYANIGSTKENCVLVRASVPDSSFLEHEYFIEHECLFIPQTLVTDFIQLNLRPTLLSTRTLLLLGVMVIIPKSKQHGFITQNKYMER